MTFIFFDDDLVGETGGEDGLEAFGEGLAYVEFAAGEVEGVACDCYGEMGPQGARALEEAAVAVMEEVEGAICDAVFAYLGSVHQHT